MKRLGAFFLLVMVATGGLFVRQSWRHMLGQGTGAAIAAVHGMGMAGLFALAGAQFLVAASGMLPASILGVAAGAVYGLGLGFMIAAGGVLSGAMVSFVLSRSMLRPFVVRHIAKLPRVAYVDRALARDGWRFVCLLRLSPLMPFAIASYTLGLSSVGFAAYCIGTLASLPALLLYVFLGTLARSGADLLATDAGVWHWLILLAGGVATIALSWRIGQLAMRAAEAIENN